MRLEAAGAMQPGCTSSDEAICPVDGGVVDIRQLTDVSGWEWVKGCSMLRAPEDIRGVNVVTAPDWHDELVLMAELASVNTQIARFVLRLLDADAGRKEEVSVAEEGNLGVRLVDVGYALQDRAAERATMLDDGGMAHEVSGSLPRQIGPSRHMTTAGDKP